MVPRTWAILAIAVAAAGHQFNQRTGTPFNYLEFPTYIVFQVVIFGLLFKLNLRDLVCMFLMRWYEFTHDTVRDWEERFAPLLAEQARRKCQDKIGQRWFVDETDASSSSRWLGKDSCLRSEYKLSKPVSSPSNQRIARPNFVYMECTLVCRQS